MNKSFNKPALLSEIPYTKRDIELVYRVFIKKYITTPQLWRIFFRDTSQKVCSNRLHKLHQYGLLRAIPQSFQWGQGRKPHLWALDKLGGQLVVVECGVDPKLIHRSPRADEENNLAIKHLLATTDFQLSLLDACQAQAMMLETWQDEFESRWQPRPQAPLFISSDGQERKPPIPDAVFTLICEGKRGIFHLEIDRATEDIELTTFQRQSIEGKLIEYLLWEESEHYQSIYGTRPLRVLFTTPGERRLQNMLKVTEKVVQHRIQSHPGWDKAQQQAEFMRLSKRFRYTTQACALQPEHLITQPIWQMAGSAVRQTMLA